MTMGRVLEWHICMMTSILFNDDYNQRQTHKALASKPMAISMGITTTLTGVSAQGLARGPMLWPCACAMIAAKLRWAYGMHGNAHANVQGYAQVQTHVHART